MLLSACRGRPPERRYLLYDLQPGEGFNLRRDVMMRAAMLARDLGPEWTLVLPPFHRMTHWKTNVGAAGLPWSTFFDVDELKKTLPVIELEEYARRQGNAVDHVVLLTAGGSGKPYTTEPRECASVPRFEQRGYRRDGAHHRARFFGDLRELEARDVRCQWLGGPYSLLVPVVRALSGRSVLVDGLSMARWDTRFGSPQHRELRKHVVFASKLGKEAQRFIDGTLGGGPYLAVHLRRGDFLQVARPHPSLEDVIEQVETIRRKLGLDKVFFATDAAPAELEILRRRLGFVTYGSATLGDGEVAIIDQLIAARAAHFVGTSSSTFTTTIQEERDLAGKPPASTYNALCKKSPAGAFDCEQPRRP